MTLALYSPSYWDVVVDVDVAALAGGKGKHPAPSTVVLGGFAWNAARTLAAAGCADLRVVTVVPSDEAARVGAAAPAGVALVAIPAPPGWLPITVVLDPGGACRILRDPGAALDGAWRWEAIDAGARAAAVHVLGRVPAGFAAAAVTAAHAAGARIAWCGGAGLAVEALARFDLVCVNAAEAATLVGATATTEAAARALLERAAGADAVRVVTGGARQPTVAASRRRGAVTVDAVAPAAIAPAAIVTLLGAGDAFAAALVATACLTDAGAARAEVDVAAGLRAGQRAAARLIAGGRDG